MDYMTELIEALDGYIGLTWTTKLEESDDKTYWTFSVNHAFIIRRLMLTLCSLQ